MWRLKVGEGNENDPYIFSTNNFLGRQIWEFDPNAGTPEERAEVEEARENFYKNRFKVHPDSDLLWQMQFLREKNFKQTVPQPKVEDGEEVTFEATTAAVKRTAHLFAALQSKDGHWPAENAGPMFYFPPLNLDGGWGLYVGSHSMMFCTALNYICMRLLGVEPDGGLDNACERARKWILDHGGITTSASWGKALLAILGVYEWAGCHPMPPEFWLFPEWFPISAAKMFCYCRLHYMPMSYLYGRKFVGPITPLIQQIREEVHLEPYDQINWSAKRHLCAKPLYMLACWAEDRNGIAFKKHLSRVPDYVWVGEDGIKMQSFGSQTWDASLVLQALLAANLSDEIGEILKKGHYFLKNSQVRENPPGDFKRRFRHISKGSWTFSDRDHGWQVSDCTAEALKCCTYFAMMPPEMVGEKLEREQFFDAVNLILSLQVKE
ncbi:Terpenoid cyclases/protein prenyltransferase alpha-alpha toroid [Corchorus olitorius]|uniref:Terpenoid cyclases/protein prenyltransferase alpha-alpha toroid n=1 Tax=Corchorus olitorius TaxID=93759 RepID=A0A1R3HVJ3_9ROSI|nr:Terpenoid cyclases/protein prenyltransferase alpha-alpha toroid [Corchorus olitorius]